MFCVECGAEGEVVEGLCRDCFIKKGRFIELPNNIDVVLCTHCGAMKSGNQWLKVDEDYIFLRAIEGALEPEKGVETFVEIEEEEEDERNYKVLVNVNVSTKGFKFDVPRETRIRLKNGVCKDCSRQRGSYYEAIVQFRARKRQPTDAEIDEALALADNIIESSGSFVTKVEDTKGGIDIYMGRTSDGRALASLLSSKFGGRMGETKKQAGRKDGIDIFRTTFLVRLPQFGRGDIVPIEGNLWEVRSFTKNRVNLEEVSTGRRRSMQMKEVEVLPVLKKEDHLVKAVVVSEDREKEEIQVMDPESYKTVDLKMPPGFKEGTKEIQLIKYEEELHPYVLKERKK
jgi:nonsense-mediated mRNA decay protein 3